MRILGKVFIVLVVMTLFLVSWLSCKCDGGPPYDQEFTIYQSAGVSASGNITFTKDGKEIGGPYMVHCPWEGNYHEYYSYKLPQQPNDISWVIKITWEDGSTQIWQGKNQPWPEIYETTHGTSFVKFEAP